MASPLTLRLDEKTRKRIARIASRKHISTSEVVRRAIEAWTDLQARHFALPGYLRSDRSRPRQKPETLHSDRPELSQTAAGPSEPSLILVEAGPLVALVDSGDQHHARCVDALRGFREPVPQMRGLMKKYANRPMDLADAALLRVAEREGIGKIFTVDRRDFSVYRLHGRIRPTLLP